MAGKRRKRKVVRIIHPSPGPLPARLADRYPGLLLAFSDASQKRQGGLAVVLFAEPDAAPLIATRSVPLAGSNELELLAALFAIEQVGANHPGRRFALFSDNRDAVDRLARAVAHGLAADPDLARRLGPAGSASLALATVAWIKGHGSCRGNILADENAAAAAA